MTTDPTAARGADRPALVALNLACLALAAAVWQRLGLLSTTAFGALPSPRRWVMLLAAVGSPLCLGSGLWWIWRRSPWGLARRLASTPLLALLTTVLFVAVGCNSQLKFLGGGTPYLGTSDAVRDAAVEAHRQDPGAAGVTLRVERGLDWPAYRGLFGDGVWGGRALIESWPAGGPKVLWKQPVGGGYASFAIAGWQAVTIEQRRDQEVIACYDIRSGRELWTHAYDAWFQERLGGNGPRATPRVAGDRVVALGATGLLTCVALKDGARHWQRDILADAGAQNIDWGMSGSPLVLGERVIVNPGGPGKAVTAYALASGEPVWQAGDFGAGYASPMRARLAGVDQLLVFGGTALASLSLDGSVLWSVGWTTRYNVNAAQPIVVGENRVLISSGYGKGAALYEVAQGAKGWTAERVWRGSRLKMKMTCGVLKDGHVYALDGTRLTCIEAATGTRRWRDGDYGHGQLVLAGNALWVLSEDGELALVRATPDGHDELGRMSVLSGRTWNIPAIAHGLLLVRNDREMACIDLRPTR